MLESTLEDKEEMNIHVMRWVIMLTYDANYNSDSMTRGLCDRRETSQMSLSKCYQNVLTYKNVNLMKRLLSMNVLMNILKLMHT